MAKRKKKSAMTASTLSQLPLMAGSVLMNQISRGAHWAFNRYLQAPLASTGIFALVTMSALAGSNALYFQTGVHPSPFFAADRSVPYAVAPVAAPVPAPAAMRDQAVEDAQQTAVAAPVVSPQTTGSVAAVPQTIPEQPVGNSEVFAVQKKLAELQLFEGKVDGYYGPMTARAIRAFEERNGFAPQGALSADVVNAILGSNASGIVATPAPAPQPVVQAAPQPQAVVAPAPAPVASQPVAVAAAPAPAPIQQPAPVAQDRVVARLPALSPVEQAVDTVGVAAATTIDSIVAAVDGTRGTGTPVANPPVPVANLPSQVMPAPVQPVVQTVASTAPTSPPRAVRPATDGELVADIQRGLASLGFFRGQIDGNPGPETARAIREFENFHRYKITGQVQPDLVDLLRKAGATI
jgi:peptidoglycan hydrolase-like protein with peptidoglycan-binding domain